LSKAIYAPIYIADNTLPIIVKYKDIFLKIIGGATCRTRAKLVTCYQWLYVTLFRILMTVRATDDSREMVKGTPSKPGVVEEDRE
jgi:hypothetical protein